MAASMFWNGKPSTKETEHLESFRTPLTPVQGAVLKLVPPAGHSWVSRWFISLRLAASVAAFLSDSGIQGRARRMGEIGVRGSGWGGGELCALSHFVLEKSKLVGRKERGRGVAG